MKYNIFQSNFLAKLTKTSCEGTGKALVRKKDITINTA
jgi:hypothetical protein